MVGLGHTIVAPYAESTIRVIPQLCFEPDRLALPETVVTSFRLLEFVADPWDHALSAKALLTSLKPQKRDTRRFHESQPGSLDDPTVSSNVADSLVLSVQNTTDKSQTFMGAIVGFATSM